MHDRKKLRKKSVHKIHIFDFWPTIISNSISTLNNNSLFYKDYKLSQILHILFIRKKNIWETKELILHHLQNDFPFTYLKWTRKKNNFLRLLMSIFHSLVWMSKTLETCILYVKRKMFKLEFGLDISHSTTHETL